MEPSKFVYHGHPPAAQQTGAIAPLGGLEMMWPTCNEKKEEKEEGGRRPGEQRE